MANTTNLDLVKPAGTDHALISVLNSNSDKIDAFAGQTNDSLSAEQNGLAYIVGNTNTTGGTLAAGQFVYVKGHSTIAEGLRKVTSSISANGSITTSNTDACSEGGLNALNSNISSMPSTVFGMKTDNYTGDMDNAPDGLVYAASTATHLPTANGYYVQTSSQGTIWKLQIAVRRNDNALFIRRKDGTWSSWVEYVTKT